MPLIIGEDKIKSIYVGDQKISKAYGADELVFIESSGGHKLPDGYTEVEYLANDTSHNPYFKMPGTASAVKMEIKLEFSRIAYSTSYAGIFGYMSTTTSGYALIVSHSKLRHLNGSTARDLVNSIQQDTPYAIVFDAVNHIFEVNGNIIAYNPLITWKYSDNYIFSNGKTPYYGVRIYFVKMWDADNNIVLEFVPCINSSGVAGMYDLVGKKMYTPVTSSFITGQTI